MASPKKYSGRVARMHVRILWLKVQSTRSQNRTHEDWLSAANRELQSEAYVKVGVGTSITLEPMPKPNDMVDLTLSFEALCGVKLAIVEGAKGAPFREREDLLDAARGFGEEFEKMCRKAAKLPESEELDEEAELEGIPVIEGDQPSKKFKAVPLPEPKEEVPG